MLKSCSCFVAALAVWLSGCAGSPQPPHSPETPRDEVERFSLERYGCSIKLPGAWRIENASEPPASEGEPEWDASSDDGESQLAVSVLRLDPAKAPDRDAVDATLGLRQGAEEMHSEDKVTFSPRHFDDDPQAPGGFYASHRAGADPMVTVVRWAKGRACIFYVTGRLVEGGNAEEFGVELLRSARAEPRAE